MSSFESRMEIIEDQIVTLGRQYIRILCEEELSHAQIDTIASITSELHEELGVTTVPNFEDLVDHEFSKVIQDVDYVKSTMQSLTKNVHQKNIKESWIMVDDVRNSSVECIARSPEMAKILLQIKTWHGIMLDHDLESTETGYDVMKWALDNNCLPNKVQLITDNPAGRSNMKTILLSFNYVEIDESKHMFVLL